MFPKLARPTLYEGVGNHNTPWHFLSSYRVWNTVQLKSVRIKASSPRPLVIPVLNSTNRIISGGRLRCPRLVCPSRPRANYPPGLGSGRQPCTWRGSRTYHWARQSVCSSVRPFALSRVPSQGVCGIVCLCYHGKELKTSILRFCLTVVFSFSTNFHQDSKISLRAGCKKAHLGVLWVGEGWRDWSVESLTTEWE